MQSNPECSVIGLLIDLVLVISVFYCCYRCRWKFHFPVHTSGRWFNRHVVQEGMVAFRRERVGINVVMQISVVAWRS